MPRASESSTQPGRPTSRLRIVVWFATSLTTLTLLLMVPAGRFDWVAGWLYMAVITTGLAINYVYLRRTNPDVIEHRLRIGKGTKGWDKVWLWLFAPVSMAVYIVAGLDAGRYAWSSMSVLMWPVGLAIFVVGMVVLIWSMAVNPFFEKTVRIQTERGHHVIDTGPYRYVRHPGYVGFAGWILSAPLLLGSWWAFVPAIVCIIAIVIRTGLEDQTLQDELTGYAEYAGRVRYRLVPGVW